MSVLTRLRGFLSCVLVFLLSALFVSDDGDVVAPAFAPLLVTAFGFGCSVFGVAAVILFERRGGIVVVVIVCKVMDGPGSLSNPIRDSIGCGQVIEHSECP